MKNKKTFLYIILILIIIIVTSWITTDINSTIDDTDYKKIGLEISANDIEYCTIYSYNEFREYKVYKIKNYYSDSMEDFKNQLDNSELWSKNKFYEYIMMEFYEIRENDTFDIDRENLYYYNQKNTYAIFDLKNAKLYYFTPGIFISNPNYNNILGIKIENYIDREVYSVRGGPQKDGIDYFTYEFTPEKGNEIQKKLNNNKEWKKEKLNGDIIDCFKYNNEVFSIENGYYHYELVCRTSDKDKKNNFTEEEATGYEVGIYDADNNRLYYYWMSY